MLNLLSKIANCIKLPRFDGFLEKLEQKADEKAKSKRLARTLAQANSIKIVR